MRIDPEFEWLIPPLQLPELVALRADIRENGVRDPVVLWGDVIVDGHNRYHITQELGLTCPVRYVEFPHREAAKAWILSHQSARRNLTNDQLSVLQAMAGVPQDRGTFRERQCARELADPAHAAMRAKVLADKLSLRGAWRMLHPPVQRPANVAPDQRVKGVSTLRNGAGDTTAEWVKTERDSDDPAAFDACPPGHLVKKVSSLLDGQGNVRAQWVQAPQAEVDRWQAACDAIDRHVERYRGLLEPTEQEPINYEQTLTCYPLGDPHLGMLAWSRETGRDFDLRIAERELLAAVRRLADGAPPSAEALLVNLGDFFHAQDDKQLTPTAGHKLDVDTRVGKLADVGFSVVRRMIECLLAKHATVHVFNMRGNHDPMLALMLDRWVRAIFEREPRIVVHEADNPYQYFRYGKVLIGIHHGDGAKRESLPAIMAHDRAQDWGETLFRYWYTGHIHQDTVKEAPGVTVESFRTLAPRDYWTHWKGYRSGQSLQSITHSREYGEIARQRVCVDMVNAA